MRKYLVFIFVFFLTFFVNKNDAFAVVTISNSHYAYIGSMGYDIATNGGALNCTASGCSGEVSKSQSANFIEFTRALAFNGNGYKFYVDSPITLINGNVYSLSMIMCFSGSITATNIIPNINNYEVPKNGDSYMLRLTDLAYSPNYSIEGYSPQNYCYMIIGTINANRGGGGFGFQVKSSSGTRSGSILGYRITWLGSSSGLSTNDISSIVNNSTTSINNNTNNKFSEVKSSIDKMNSDISKGLSDVNQTQKETNQKLDKLDDTLKSEDYDDSRYSELAGLLPPGPLDSLLNLPIEIIGKLMLNLRDSSCPNLVIPLPFVNSSFVFPCFKTIFEDLGWWTFYSTYIGTIAAAILLYYYLSHLSYRVQKLLVLDANFVTKFGGV